MGTSPSEADLHREGVEPAAAVGFGRQAASYARVRPDYPPDVFTVLRDEAKVVPGGLVADVGAGTGILTAQLAEAGYEVVAIEPIAGMREEFRRRLDVPVLDGLAEALPLEDASVDAVTIAQAFHWFDPQPALAEAARVLRPGGALLLIWNSRNEDVDWMRSWGDVVNEAGGGRPYSDHREMLWEDVVAESGRFDELRHREFEHSQSGDAAMIIERTRSTSFIAALPPERHQLALDEVARLLKTHPETAGREIISIPYRTFVYWCHRSA